MACGYRRAVHSISPGRLAEANHTPWAVCLGSSLPCQIKPGPSYAAAVFGVQLGRPKCGGSPASRGLAGLGVTGLSAARLRAGTTVDAFSAVLAFASRGAQRVPVKCGALTARDSRWAAPDQPTRPLARSRPAGGARTGPPPAGSTGRLDADSDAGSGRSGSLVDHGPCHHVIPGHGIWPLHEHDQVTAFGLCTSMIRA
jgi:hypothetical protein